MLAGAGRKNENRDLRDGHKIAEGDGRRRATRVEKGERVTGGGRLRRAGRTAVLTPNGTVLTGMPAGPSALSNTQLSVPLPPASAAAQGPLAPM